MEDSSERHQCTARGRHLTALGAHSLPGLTCLPLTQLWAPPAHGAPPGPCSTFTAPITTQRCSRTKVTGAFPTMRLSSWKLPTPTPEGQETALPFRSSGENGIFQPSRKQTKGSSRGCVVTVPQCGVRGLKSHPFRTIHMDTLPKAWKQKHSSNLACSTLWC